MCNDSPCEQPCENCSCDTSHVFPPSLRESVSQSVNNFASAELAPISTEQSTVTDLSQPANEWLEAILELFQTHLDAGEDPSFSLQVDDVKFELRLLELPGVYKRKNHVIGEDEEG